MRKKEKNVLNGPFTTSIGFALDMNFMGSLYTFVDFVEGLYLKAPGEEGWEDNEDNNEVENDDDNDFLGNDEIFDGDEKSDVTI